MRAGRLVKTVTIEQVIESQSSTGQVVETWQTYAIRRASVEPLKGREFFDGKQVYGETTMRFRLRYDSKTGAIRPKMRLSYDSKTFDIQSVINVREKNREILILASEVV